MSLHIDQELNSLLKRYAKRESTREQITNALAADIRAQSSSDTDYRETAEDMIAERLESDQNKLNDAVDRIYQEKGMDGTAIALLKTFIMKELKDSPIVAHRVTKADSQGYQKLARELLEFEHDYQTGAMF